LLLLSFSPLSEETVTTEKSRVPGCDDCGDPSAVTVYLKVDAGALIVLFQDGDHDKDERARATEEK
jgi:hypothetical protein